MLDTLFLYPPSVDGLSFAPLASLPELRHLSIDQRDYHDHTELSDAQVAELRALPLLRRFDCAARDSGR